MNCLISILPAIRYFYESIVWLNFFLLLRPLNVLYQQQQKR